VRRMRQDLRFLPSLSFPFSFYFLFLFREIGVETVCLFFSSPYLSFPAVGRFLEREGKGKCGCFFPLSSFRPVPSSRGRKEETALGSCSSLCSVSDRGWNRERGKRGGIRRPALSLLFFPRGTALKGGKGLKES